MSSIENSNRMDGGLNTEQIRKLNHQEMIAANKQFGARPHLKMSRKILESATGDCDRTCVDFPEFADASWYRMVFEALGRGFNAQVEQFDENNCYTGNMETELYWLKATKKYITERMTKIKSDMELLEKGAMKC